MQYFIIVKEICSKHFKSKKMYRQIQNAELWDKEEWKEYKSSEVFF